MESFFFAEKIKYRTSNYELNNIEVEVIMPEPRRVKL